MSGVGRTGAGGRTGGLTGAPGGGGDVVAGRYALVDPIASGRRVNPAVYGRVVRLEQLQTDPRVAGGDLSSIAVVLDEVAASSPVLTTVTAQVHTTGGERVPTGSEQLDLVHRLATLARPEQLVATAAAAEAAGATTLAAVLRQAAG